MKFLTAFRRLSDAEKFRVAETFKNHFQVSFKTSLSDAEKFRVAETSRTLRPYDSMSLSDAEKFRVLRNYKRLASCPKTCREASLQSRSQEGDKCRICPNPECTSRTDALFSLNLNKFCYSNFQRALPRGNYSSPWTTRSFH